jgi:hypothetical protein
MTSLCRQIISKAHSISISQLEKGRKRRTKDCVPFLKTPLKHIMATPQQSLSSLAQRSLFRTARRITTNSTTSTALSPFSSSPTSSPTTISHRAFFQIAAIPATAAAAAAAIRLCQSRKLPQRHQQQAQRVQQQFPAWDIGSRVSSSSSSSTNSSSRECRRYFSSSSRRRGLFSDWKGTDSSEHITNSDDNLDVYVDASKSGRADRSNSTDASTDSGNDTDNSSSSSKGAETNNSSQSSLAQSTSQQDQRNSNKRAEQDHPEAPGPVIGMNDERGSVSFSPLGFSFVLGSFFPFIFSEILFSSRF